MGIKGLINLITKEAPHTVQVRGTNFFRGRSLAIDTNIFLYSFVTAIRKDATPLVDSEGNTTSHLKGIVGRTINLLESGVVPVYVLEGTPPEMKRSELEKRQERREKAQKNLEEALKFGDTEGAERYSKQLVRVTQVQSQECEHILKLLGVPVIQAPAESEAQCAEFCKKGQVWGLVTKDMDALALGSPVMLRNLHTKHEYTTMKTRVEEIKLVEVIDSLKLDLPQFVDLCILLGCDYSETIKGIGPIRAYELIKNFKTIENILDHLRKEDYYASSVGSGFNYEQARTLFHNPLVIPAEQFHPSQFLLQTPDYAAAQDYLISKSFNPVKVNKLLQRSYKAHTRILQEMQ